MKRIKFQFDVNKVNFEITIKQMGEPGAAGKS